ncbi:hypothetical protein RJT34_22772 [Clitoria ternatea]|uniref:Uncharacterized protein n=1 Tax=Clitoria ternatea TaxID=43366 RepID=A0AAN9FMW1_CLITE
MPCGSFPLICLNISRLVYDNEYQNYALGSNISTGVQHVEKENGTGDKIGEAQQLEFIVAQSVEFENDSGQP